MADLSVLNSEQFDLIVHPAANMFVPDVNLVWRECARVLKPDGRILSGIVNPSFFWFDHKESERAGRLEVKYQLPFSTLTSLEPAKRDERIAQGGPLEFGHTLYDQIGGQIVAGFVIIGFYEDNWSDDATPLNRFGSLFFATLARKMRPFERSPVA
jgi:SAM-dependent methyltransferase